MQQLFLQPEELEAIVARLNAPNKREIKNNQEQARTVKLVYQKDSAKGYKEAYMPVKRVRPCCQCVPHAMSCVALSCRKSWNHLMVHM